MLDLIRKKKESVVVKAVFVIIVLSFVGTIFLVWGKGEEGMGRQAGFAAKVDRTVISLDAYQNAYQNMVDTYRQLFGENFTPELEKQLDLRQQTLDRLIDNTLILNNAKSVGVTVHKGDVVNAIAAMPAFQQNGTFDFALYQQTLKMNRITAEAFEDAKKRELLLEKTRKAVMGRVTVSDEDALKQFHKEYDKVELDYLSFSPAELASEVKVDDGALQAYLSQNPDGFKSPEKVAVSWFLLEYPPQPVGAAPGKEELESFYRKNLDRYMDKDNTPLPFEQVKEQVKQDAMRQKASKELYEKSADTLFQNIKSGDLQLVAGKLGAKVHETHLFTADAAPTPFTGEGSLLQKFFSMKQGELGGPVETAKGIYIFKIKEKRASELPPLALVRPAVEKGYREMKGAELAKQGGVDAQKGLAAGNTDLRLTSTPPFNHSDKGEIPGIGKSNVLMSKVFELTAANPALTEPVLVNGRWYAVRLKQRAVAADSEFAAKKEEIKQRMLPARQEEALANWIKELRGKAKIVTNPALTAR